MPAKQSITLTVNGAAFTRDVEPRRLLSDFLRQDIGMTGVHVGCEHGVCGACTVMLDGETARACLCLAVQANGRAISTVEGLGAVDEPNLLQRKFREHHALQCGFCTPGMLMTGMEILEQRKPLSDDEIRHALSGNLCRCTGYENIVRAVSAALKEHLGG